MFINSKEELINYFQKGAKKELFIGVENEKFLFDQTTNSRAAYPKVKEVLNYLKKFGWQEITEGEHLIGLKNNGKNIYIESVSVVGIDNYALGTKSENYDSIITIASPYETTYINCSLEKNETEFLLYICDSFQYYCGDGFNCIQIYIDRNKEMYIDKQYSTYLYQQGTSQDKKYALGEFVYDKNLSFKSYEKLKVLQ